jgi:membrane protein
MRAADRVTGLLPPHLLRMATRAVRDFAQLEVFDRAMTLAAQAFTSIFPLIIAVAAIRPGQSDSLGEDLADVLSAPDSSRQVLEQALPTEPRTIGAFGLVGFFIVLISATSFSRALARMYAKIWQVKPPSRLRGAWRWVAALSAIAASLIVLGLLRAAWHGVPYDTLLDLVVAFAISTVIWTWAPWLLLGAAVSWRRLLPGGALMGLGTALISVASQIYLPRALNSAARQYGALGIAFAYISWLFVVMVVLVGTTVAGAAIAREHDAHTAPAGAAAGPAAEATPDPAAE